MNLLSFNPRDFIPVMAMAIPIIAIIGGITAGIMKTMGRQRLMELAQRERIAAIERGLDPGKLPPLSDITGGGDASRLELLKAIADESRGEWQRSPRQRAQGLMIGGIITLFSGVGLSIFLSIMEDDGEAWAVGILPGAIGLALLISAFLIWPKDEK